MGAADDSAIILDNVRSADFAKLLWVFYNPVRRSPSESVPLLTFPL